MSERKIVILYSDGSKKDFKFISKIRHNSGYWLYFGKDYLNFKKIESSLEDKFEYIEISEMLDKISDLIRDDYNHYIDKVNRLNKDIFEWWFTPLSSRNIYLGEVFQNVCYLQLIKNIYSEYLDKDLLVVVESSSIGMLIEKWAESENILINSMSRPYRGSIYRFSQAFLAIGKTTFKAFANCAFAKISNITTSGNKKKINSFSEGKTALIDLFVYESNFNEDGSFNDRYFPGLESHLIKNGYNVIYHPTFAETKLNKYNLYRKMRASKFFFVVAEDFLQISDYIGSLILSVKVVLFSGEIPAFKDYDIFFFDKCENKWSCFDGIFKSILIYNLFLRLGNHIGENIERVISWHENQLQDKALSLAVHENFDGTKILGLHHFIHYFNYLSPHPINSEAENLLLPDKILTTGVFESNKLKKNLSFIPVNESAALRYSYLFNPKSKMNLHLGEILVLLPYEQNDAFEILIRVGEVLKDLKCIPKILVKCHPDYSEEIFLDTFNGDEFFDMFTFTDKKLDILFNSAGVVISTASSSMVESAVMGIPTILLSKAHSLTLNPFSCKNENYVSVCYDKSQLTDLLNNYVDLSEDKMVESVMMWESKKGYFFTTISEDTLNSFID